MKALLFSSAWIRFTSVWSMCFAFLVASSQDVLLLEENFEVNAGGWVGQSYTTTGVATSLPGWGWITALNQTGTQGSYRHNAPPAAGAWFAWSPNITVNAGEQYYVRFWVTLSGGNSGNLNRAQVRVTPSSTPVSLLSVTNIIMPATNIITTGGIPGYQEFTSPVWTATSSDTFRFLVGDFFNATGFACYLDGIRIYRVNNASITTQAIPGDQACQGASASVSHTVSGTFNTGNTFSVQLSNASGSFASPVVIGTSSGTMNGSTLATIPLATAPGAGYKVRVVSSNPVVTGSEVSLTVLALQTWYLDADGDGFASATALSCSSPGAGYTLSVLPLTDCDDGNTLRYPGAAEVCGNSLDDDCDGFTDEGCGPPPANDNRAAAVNLNVFEINTCVAVSGTVAGATPSPQATSTVVTGEDVWYRFTANSPGVRIVLQGNAFNALIELQDAAGNALEMENAVSSAGAEILNHYNPVSPLTLGQQYFVCIRNVNSAGGSGSFTICLQRIRATSCNISAGPFSTCSNFKATSVGAVGYQFVFTNTVTLQQTMASTANGITITPLSVLLPGAAYSASITAQYALVNGAGQTESFEIASPSSCTFQMAPHVNIELRSSDWCSNGPRLPNALIAAHTWLCGASHYEWRFRQVAPVLDVDYGTPVAGLPTNRFLSLPVAGLIAGATYDVQVRPIFPGNVAGTWSTTPRCLQIVGPAGMQQEDGSEAIYSLRNAHASVPDVRLYPNPNRGDRMVVELGEEAGLAQVRILDATGREVAAPMSVFSSPGRLDIAFDEHPGAGVYLVEISAGFGKLTCRMVVQP